MTDTVENLILDLLEWIGRKERTYQETMDAWRASWLENPMPIILSAAWGLQEPQG